MAEVLGVVSAAAQLATLCCSLLRVMKKVKGAGLTLQNYELQLQDLSLLSSSISRNPLLQTIEIGTLTQSLLSLISQANLTFVLKKHRIIRTLYILCKERELVDTLTAVERQKLSLCLSIEQIQSDTLYEIRASIQDMSHEQQNIGRKRTAAQDTAKESQTPSSKNSDLKMSSAPSESSTTDVKSDNKTSAAPVNNYDKSLHVFHPPVSQTLFKGSVTGVKISGKTDATVGIEWEGDASELVHMIDSTKYTGIDKDGEGKLGIGPRLRYHGDLVHDFDFSPMSGTVDGVRFNGVESKDGVAARLSIGPKAAKQDCGK